MTKIFCGALTAVVTPFNNTGEIDLVSLKKLIEFQIAGGVDGIVACGSTGEAATLSIEEYRLVLEAVVSLVARRVPVIAGAGSNDTRKAVELSRIAEAVGVSGLLHVTPFYNRPTEAGLIGHYLAIGEAVDLPIILYNVPGRTGSNVLPAVINRIVQEVPSVIGVKEASGKMEQIMELIHISDENFTVLSGDDVLTLPVMAAGGDGCISVVSNEVPGDFSRMIHLAADGNWTEAREIHYRLFDLMRANFIESNPIPVKTVLAMMGLIKEQLRLPLCPVDDENRIRLEKIAKEMNLI